MRRNIWIQQPISTNLKNLEFFHTMQTASHAKALEINIKTHGFYEAEVAKSQRFERVTANYQEDIDHAIYEVYSGYQQQQVLQMQHHITQMLSLDYNACY